MAADLSTAAGRVRYAVGDTDDTDVAMPPGSTAGIAVYATLLTQHDDDEALAYRAAAGLLAAYWARQVTSLSSSGKSLTWAARVPSWQDMASGNTPYPLALVGGSPEPPVTPSVAAFATVAGRRGR